MSNYWNNKKVAVLGGAALIGSHLVDKLLLENPKSLWVLDDLSAGKSEYVNDMVAMVKIDLRDYNKTYDYISGADVVFHLACAHGGRGYVDTHRTACFDNVSLDATVFRACARNNVEKVVFMSSACAYPTRLQQDITESMYLTEDLLNYDNIEQADGAYGLAKLIGELVVRSYGLDGIFDYAICRGFTVYGPRMKENHAIGALMAKLMIKQDPFEIWGNGKQLRNWTYVEDTVDGLILAAEKLKNDVVNIGTMEVNTPNSALEILSGLFNWKPKEIKYLLDKPVGVLNRIADNNKANQLLGWKPKYTFDKGLENTVEWYRLTHNIAEVKANLERSLTER